MKWYIRDIICMIFGHITGKMRYWDSARKEWYRDFRRCSRCGRHL